MDDENLTRIYSKMVHSRYTVAMRRDQTKGLHTVAMWSDQRSVSLGLVTKIKKF